MRHLSRDSVLRGLIDRYGLVSHPPSRDPFRDLAWAIVSQQLSSKAAASIWQRFELKFGGKCPDPAKVAAVSVEELRAIGLSGPKAAYTIDLATKFCDGVVVAAELPFLEDEEIAERLLSIKGIGKWSVDMFLMFGLNRPDVLPVGDLGIKRALFNLYGLEGFAAS